MKICVIGGSYFLGRWFVQYAHKSHEIIILNRGNVPVDLPNITQIKLDRHDETALLQLKKELGVQSFDCIVDFCAYQKGDIQTMVDVIGGPDSTYFFVSTVDVYKRGSKQLLTEESVLESRHFDGPEGDYIAGKVQLEAELVEACKKVDMKYCALRPSLIYGPANYAPREQMFFDWIKQAGQIIVPSDATGFFQPIYVEDVARMILMLCERANATAYNLCPNQIETYESFVRALHEASDTDFEEIRIPVSEIFEKQIPLPYPLTESESEHYDGSRILELYEERFGPLVSLSDGLKRCMGK